MTVPLDLLRSTKEIAEALNCSVRQAQYLCEKSQIPVFKIGNIWHARRATLERHLEQLEQAALAGANAEPAPIRGDRKSAPQI